MSSAFRVFGLDERLLQAIAKLGFTEPTPIQEKGIQIALEDKNDIVAKAKTGSGKTAAYLLPILHNLLLRRSDATRALLLVPSRELADQLTKVLAGLTMYTDREITYVNIAQQVADKVKSTLLADKPNIVIATPSSARTQIEAGNLALDDLNYLVLDEADLLTSYGFLEDLEALRDLLTKSTQTWLMSATLSEDIDQLKTWFCRTPVTLKLEDTQQSQLSQYYVKTSEIDKFLLAYVIFKLGLIKGKVLIFVNDTDRCYRLKLFFEQFGIKSAALNAELPLASRLHIVEQFNHNVYNILIATDEAQAPEEKEKEGSTEGSKPKRPQRDAEYGVSRGVDFKNVSCVINFDLPISTKVYTHRIGRTARANKTGMALSFVVPKEEFGRHKIATVPTGRRDEKTLARIIRGQEQQGNEVVPYQFDMKQMDSFRYRMEDAFRAVTRVAVREARVKELKSEIIASDKLQRHFEENPDDLLALRHDLEVHPSRVQAELRRIPDYLLPASAKTTKPIFVAENVRFNKNNHYKRGFKGGKNGRAGKKGERGAKKHGRRDPLKSFSR